MFRNLYIVIYSLQNLKNIFHFIFTIQFNNITIFNLFFSLYSKLYNILYNLVINKGKIKCYFKSIKVLIYIRRIHIAYIIHMLVSSPRGSTGSAHCAEPSGTSQNQGVSPPEFHQFPLDSSCHSGAVEASGTQ